MVCQVSIVGMCTSRQLRYGNLCLPIMDSNEYQRFKLNKSIGVIIMYGIVAFSFVRYTIVFTLSSLQNM